MSTPSEKPPAPALFASRLKTNVKGELDTALGPLTLVVGPNASHKSGLRAALELGLTGNAEGSGKVGARIMEFAPPGEKTVRVAIDVTDLREVWAQVAGGGAQVQTPAQALAQVAPVGSVSFSVTGTTIRASRPVVKFTGRWNGGSGGGGGGKGSPRQSFPVGALLIDEVRDLFSQNATRQREAILKLVAPPKILAQLRAEVPEAFRAELETVLVAAKDEAEAVAARGAESTGAPEDDNASETDIAAGDLVEAAPEPASRDARAVRVGEADIVVAAAEVCRRAIRRVNEDAKAGAEAEANAPRIVTDEEVAQWRAQVEAKRAAEAQARKTEGARARLQAIMAHELPAARSALAMAQEAVRIAAQREGVPDASALVAQRGVVTAVAHVVGYALREIPAEAWPVGCPVCGHDLAHEAAEESERRAAEAEAALAKEEAHARAASGVGTVAQAQRGVDAMTARVESLETQARELQGLVGVVAAIGAEDEGESGGDGLSLGELETRLSEALTEQTRRAQWEEVRARASKAAGRVDVLKAIGKTIERAIVEVLEAAVTSFEAEASRALPQGSALKVQLFDKGKPVCRIGLRRFKTASARSSRMLAGSERALVIGAFASAWAMRRTEALRVIAIDEVWLKDEAMLALMAGLKRAWEHSDGAFQVVLCVAVAPGVVSRAEAILAGDAERAQRVAERVAAVTAGWHVVELPERAGAMWEAQA